MQVFFFSIDIFHVRRSELYKSGLQNDDLSMNGLETMNPGDRFFADISAMASTIAYENESVIKERVNHHWKVGH